jgi:hypothetical protein
MRITKTKIVKDSETGEYIVKAYSTITAAGLQFHGRIPSADYFASDIDDARDTARAMVADSTDSGPAIDSPIWGNTAFGSRFVNQNDGGE